MAALTADVAVVFDPALPIGLRQAPAVGADTYYRGSTCHSNAGLLDNAHGALDDFYGVAMENRVTAAANDLVWIATLGRFHFACVLFTAANHEDDFAALAATLFDNPADLGLATTGTSGSIGVLDQVTVEAVSGWLNISRRNPAANA